LYREIIAVCSEIHTHKAHNRILSANTSSYELIFTS